MKHVRKSILAGCAFLCATSLSFGWSDHGGVALSVASVQARVGRPATPVSVAGVTRRHLRHGAYVGAGLAGAAAIGTAAAIGSAYNGYYGAGYGTGPYEAYDAMPYGAYGVVPYGAYGAVPYGAYGAVPYGAYGYGYGCTPGPRVGAFATAPWTNTPTCPPY
jgi:hypothetical protein